MSTIASAFAKRFAAEISDGGSATLRVTPKKAIVTGEVFSEALKQQVGQIAADVSGREVENRLVVAAPLTPATSWDPFDRL